MQIQNINMEIDILSIVWWILCKCSRKNAKKIEEYIPRQLDEDKAGEQLTKGNY